MAQGWMPSGLVPPEAKDLNAFSISKHHQTTLITESNGSKQKATVE